MFGEGGLLGKRVGKFHAFHTTMTGSPSDTTGDVLSFRKEDEERMAEEDGGSL